MRHRWLILLALIGGWNEFSLADEADVAAAVKAIEQLKGGIVRNTSLPQQPVMSIDFADQTPSTTSVKSSIVAL